jgi:hypothetical protein
MMRYLSALLLHIKRRLEYEKGGVISVKTRAVCRGDRRCGRFLNNFMMSLVEKGLARMHKRGVYLIERKAVNEVLKILEERCGGCPPKAAAC